MELYCLNLYIFFNFINFLGFDFLFFNICCRSEMLLTNIMNICYNGVILLKCIFFFPNFIIFLGFI